MLSSWISAFYLKDVQILQLKQSFLTAEPFPFAALPEFFLPKKAEAVRLALRQEPFERKEADLFQFFQTQDIRGTASLVLQEFRTFLASWDFIQYLEQLTGIALQQGTIDMAGTLYEDTDFLLCHDDQLERRRLAYFLYLSDLQEQEGGELQLFASQKGQPQQVARTIVPKFNTFAFFLVSPASFHAVAEMQVKKQRWALSGWFHG